MRGLKSVGKEVHASASVRQVHQQAQVSEEAGV